MLGNLGIKVNAHPVKTGCPGRVFFTSVMLLSPQAVLPQAVLPLCPGMSLSPHWGCSWELTYKNKIKTNTLYYKIGTWALSILVSAIRERAFSTNLIFFRHPLVNIPTVIYMLSFSICQWTSQGVPVRHLLPQGMCDTWHHTNSLASIYVK